MVDTKVVILAGGLGTRLSEETVVRPKPMVEIGGKPILWHIMKMYSHFGFNDFIICLGYKGYMIKEYFANYNLHMSDVTIDIKNNTIETLHNFSEPWNVSLIDTGDATLTGGRVKRIQPYIGDEPFMLTYGDGVSDINIPELLQFHTKKKKIGTLTAIRPPGRFGVLEIRHDQTVTSFLEKPPGNGGHINGGFFVFEPELFDYLKDDTTILERVPLESLANKGQLNAFKHEGFWYAMDTMRDKNYLEDEWATGKAPLEAVEVMTVPKKLAGSYKGRKVLITGHTGFKGSWLALWLESLGAQVIGYSLDPPTDPSFFQATGISDRVVDIRGNILDRNKIFEVIHEHRPEYIFHLAAQPLVRFSYNQPLETFEVNVMGTAHILEAVRLTHYPVTCICITSDKCYANRECDYAYQEQDPLGGHDPYSASKAAAELVIASYRKSFFGGGKDPVVSLSSVRAGNIIGGGDWAEDRIVPDCVRALVTGNPVEVRNPRAVRPWQFVLDPLFGYLCLALNMRKEPEKYAGAWNFGPDCSDTTDVQALAEKIIREWGSGTWKVPSLNENAPHEAGYLKLDSTKSIVGLGWKPAYAIDDAVRKTIGWYRTYYAGDTDMYEFSLLQVERYMRDAVSQG